MEKNRDLEWATALSGKRQPDAEGAAFARSTLGGDAAAELLHQGLCDGKSQSHALAGAGAIGPVEALEDVRQISSLDADPRVTYPQRYSASRWWIIRLSLLTV